jgi:hypothetical protein
MQINETDTSHIPDERDWIIGILVDRLGGDVTIDEAELADGDLSVRMWHERERFRYRFQTKRKPVPIDGEVVSDTTDAELVDEPATRRALTMGE